MAHPIFITITLLLGLNNTAPETTRIQSHTDQSSAELLRGLQILLNCGANPCLAIPPASSHNQPTLRDRIAQNRKKSKPTRCSNQHHSKQSCR